MVVNYLPFDIEGRAPEVSLRTNAQDRDNERDGLQVEVGSQVPLILNVTDDLQVAYVELIVNGRTILRDDTPPFEPRTLLAEAPGEDRPMIIQARAVDTGRNEALSNRLVIDVVPDTTAPQIVGSGPRTEEELIVVRAWVRFDSAMRLETLHAGTITAVDDEGREFGPDSMQFREDDHYVQMVYNALPAGDYRILLDGPIVTDRAGNPLGDGPVEVARFPVAGGITEDFNGTFFAGRMFRAIQDEPEARIAQPLLCYHL